MWLVDLIVVRVRLPEQTRLRKLVGLVETRRSGPVAPYELTCLGGLMACTFGCRGGVGKDSRIGFERARGLSLFTDNEANVGPVRSLQAGPVPAVAVIEGRALDDSS
jgi:hypothetical protein